MKTLLTLCITVFLCTINALAQKEANNWYFGNGAGLSFSTGSPVSIGGGQLNTTEGSASVSDGAGNLLFYTDGVTIWNANHVPMANGNGLSGNGSSTQSALIVRKPGSANLYYVFTTGTVSFDYSIVDMTLNGGLGDVTIKNTVLHPTSNERATAVRMPNGLDFWILGHEATGNGIFAYQLTGAGMNTVPVMSNIGVAQTGADGIGYLRASHAGDKLAMAVRYKDAFELFDFDKTTGILSNLITFPNYDHPYGVEFSPDDSRLYISGGLGSGYIYQADLTAGSPAAIVASATALPGITTGNMWALELGPDCKIYAVHYTSTSIGVINDPNALGVACNYVDNQFNLISGTGSLGLPNFFEMPGCLAFSIQSGCLGDTTFFSLGNTTAVIGAQWNFGDTISGTNNTSTLFNPSHLYSSSGTYSIQVVLYYLSGNVDTLNANVTINALPNINLGNDTTICYGTAVLLDAGTGFGAYLWSDGSTNSTLSVADEGVYTVSVSNGNCFGVDTIVVDTISCMQPIVAFASTDTSICEKTCLDFFDLSTNIPTTWQWYFPNASPDTSTLQNPTSICFNTYGAYDVQLIACNSNGCDTLTIPAFISIYQSPAAPVITQSNDTLFCNAVATTYQWYLNNAPIAGATNSYYVFSISGLYYCIITDSNLCDAASNAITDVGLNPLWNSAFELFPNPNNGQFNLVLSDKWIENTEFEIFDARGRMVFTQKINSRKINIRKEFSAGLYSILLKQNDKVYMKKFVVE